MSIVAGMDLGFGSQVKIVTTNYLVVNAAAAPTDLAVSRFLQIVNNSLTTGITSTATRQKGAVFDYILCDTTVPTITSPNIIDATGTTTVPLIGPSPGAARATGTGIVAGVNDTAALQGVTANGVILAVLSASAGIMLTDEATDTFDTFTAVELANLGAGTGASSTILGHLQAELLAAQLTGTTLTTLDVTDVLAEVAAETLTSLTLSAAIANLNASYVAAGNAAGDTATKLSDVTANNDKVGVISITGLVRTAQ